MKKTTVAGIALSITVAGTLLGAWQLMPEARAQEVQGETDPVVTPVIEAPDGAYAQLIRLVQAGVDEGVILTFVKQSPRFFELDADDIIYLSDIGTSSEVIQAAMARDQELFADGITTQPPAPAVAEEAVAEAEAEPVAVSTVEEKAPEVADVDFNVALSPYGTWVYIEGYGRCWRPAVSVNNSNWRPYVDGGQWVYTDQGWYWNSNYNWGWAAFHYGRWFLDARYGWCWWPDTVWGPSWVHWRYDDSHCGWAPLPPYTVYRPGIGLVYRGRSVHAGFDFGLGFSAFSFVSVHNLCHSDLRHYRIDGRKARMIYSRTHGGRDIHHDPHLKRIVNPGIPTSKVFDPSSRHPRPVAIEVINNKRRVVQVEHQATDRSGVLNAARNRVKSVTKPTRKVTKPATPKVVRPARNSQSPTKPAAKPAVKQATRKPTKATQPAVKPAKKVSRPQKPTKPKVTRTPRTTTKKKKSTSDQ